jgi:hypothetical protein
MTKVDIQNKLLENHEHFIAAIDSLNEDEFSYAPAGKWNAGQQLDHIYRAVSILSMGMKFPKVVLKVFFGKADRQSRTYDQLVERYIQRLSGGGKASGRFVPKTILFSQKEKSIKNLFAAVTKLYKHVDHYTEQDLDKYILPHPLMGKLTVREMMFFTIYHAQHHQRLTLKNLGSKNS